MEAPDGVELRLVIVAPREELTRTADLLRRTHKETLPKSLTLSLPAGGERGAEHRPDRESAPRGSPLVK